MTLVIKIPDTSFTDTTIAKLYRDQIANAGTLDIFDSKDTYSWAKQGNPTEGSDTWKSLIGTVPNTAAFAGTIEWSNGFAQDDTADIISLPSTFKIGASSKGVLIFWTKVGTQVSTTGNGIIAWTGDNAANCQFLAYLDHNTTDATTFVAMLDTNGTQQILVEAVSVLGASKIAQIAVSFEPESGGYRIKSFLNGVRKGSYLRGALATLPQPTAVTRIGGVLSGFTNAYIGTTFRAVVDDLSVMTPETFVALDYQTYSTRFS